MPYTPDKPKLTESPDELRARIPGWGADLDPADRPSVPQERFAPEVTGAHWEFPERQPEKWPRERSIEHKFLTPVFGTSCPPKGLSGVIRRYSYRRFSEGRAAHWLLLLAADRVDTAESRLGSLLRGHPDNLVAETGVRAEITGHGLASRLRGNRVDRVHHPLDPIVVAAPWLLAGGVAYLLVRRVARRG
ncbi:MULTISPECIES: hypothetical protein [unclassified Micromonospora]|uniref:hypothetical protein n=1 Tax=unclassified Micromonospora TaxID=2617518 RepID=UPI001B361AD2|nr:MULTISPECIES: hypothetical protein [unclassified Micromonospora]MBQ1046284.1 hypothetical protein [Micromonospora sp. C72]MBQ1058813.1 hypothetical protein [Micromonospora sp. C32]